MKRTTIFPSRLSKLAAVSALAVASLVLPPRVVAQAQPPAGTAPAAAQPATPPPATHVVQQGETLWALAQQYFGDPLLWPEIYRLNTSVIEDPHWIFPGEQLALGGAPAPAAQQVAMDTTQQAPSDTVAAPPPAADTTQAAGQPGVQPPGVEAPAPPPPPPPGDMSAPTIFSQRAQQAGSMVIGAVGGDVYRYRPVRRGEFYSAGFLTEDTSFPWARVAGNPFEPRIERTPTTSSVDIYQEVELEAPGGATYQPGDSLLTARLGREVPGWGNVVIPSGIVRVLHTKGNDVLAEVIQQFNRIVDGQVALPLEPFHDPGMVTPLPVDSGLASRVITVRDVHAVADQQNIVFIDAGRNQGVVLGDLFEVRQAMSDAPTGVQQRVALLQIVHVRDRSASGLILQIYQPGLQAGQPAQLIRKMPS
jgi:LysM domain